MVPVRAWVQHLKPSGNPLTYVSSLSLSPVSLSLSFCLSPRSQLHVHIATCVASQENYLSISTLILNSTGSGSASQKLNKAAEGHPHVAEGTAVTELRSLPWLSGSPYLLFLT